MIAICAVALAGCQTSATVCDGWRPLYPKPATVGLLVQKDRTLAEGIAAHNEHGKRSRCW